MQRVDRRGSQVLSECCKVGYSATLARAHVHNYIYSENRVGVRCSQWRALSARSSGRQKRNPVPILLQMCFLLPFIAFQVRIVHQRPLCIRSLTTKLLTQKRPYAQLLSRIPRRRVIQPGFFCSFLLQYNVPPTWLCCSVWQP